MKSSTPFWVAIGLWLSAAGIPAAGIEYALTPETRVSFASLARAREILGTRDGFIQALSPFDRAARVKTAQVPSEAEFIAFLQSSASEWSSEETNRIGQLIATLAKSLESFHLPIPPRIELVKTSGKEEGNAAYTRQAAIILPQAKADTAGIELLAHELFHILSRNDPEMRSELYEIIGFKTGPDIQLPADLQKKKITNPDGFRHDAVIVVQHENQSLPVVPILFASVDSYDPAKGGEFFQYLTFKLMPVRSSGGRYMPLTSGAKTPLLTPGEVQGFYEQIGRNTKYIIHPDEILAENFVHLIMSNTNLPTPAIPARMKELFQSRRGKTSTREPAAPRSGTH